MSITNITAKHQLAKGNYHQTACSEVGMLKLE